MAGNRKWVTREEIAELHEAIAQSNMFDENANYHMEAAEDIRATERLSKPLGWRVA